MAALGEDLLGIVNKLQDLVFNTIGSDSLDLPQIVRRPLQLAGRPAILEFLTRLLSRSSSAHNLPANPLY